MSSPAPVSDDVRMARQKAESIHGGHDGLDVANTENPMAGIRRPVTTPISDAQAQFNSPFDSAHRDAESAPSPSQARESEAMATAPDNVGLGNTGGSFFSRVGKMFSSAGDTMSGAASSAWSGMKWMGSKIKGAAQSGAGLLSRGLQSVRSGIKSNASDYSQGVNTVAKNSIDPLADAIGTKKFDPKVSADSLNWSSRKKTDAGTVQIHDADERRMARAIDEGTTKNMLHNPAFNLSEDQRVTLAKNQLLANKLKQSGSGGLYDKDVAKARAAEPVDATAKAGQVVAEASEATRRVASTGISNALSATGELVSGVNVANAVKHGAMLSKIAGQAALESDSGRQQRAADAKVANREASANLKSTVEDYRTARQDWAGKDDADLTDEQKTARHGAVKKNFQSVFAKLKANKEALVANRAAGIGGALDEYKMKHTNSVDGKTGTLRDHDDAIAHGADAVYGMPMGKSSTAGQIAQGVRQGTQALEFAGKVATGSGAQDYLDKGEHAKAAAISAGGLGTELAAMAGTAVVPGVGGHGVKTIIKGAGYGAQLVGKAGTEGMNKLASAQDQHDRYNDVMSGARRDAVAENPIDFQGAQDMYDPGGLTGAYNKTRDAAAKTTKKFVRGKLGGVDSD
ncbi:MAG: hypothetical protein RL205_267 [Actinomycetota bacterium]